MNGPARDHLIAGERLGSRYSLHIPQTALAGMTGQQLGRRAGSSVDFQDYREYAPGDDLRSIDWNVFARTDKLTIKLFREEVNPHLDIVFDGSRSMNLDGSEKGRGALQLAAVLGVAAENARCSHALWLAGEGFRRARNDQLRPSAWDGLAFETSQTVEESFAILPPRFRRLGLRVLVSDLFWPGDPMTTLRRLADGAAAVFVIQLLSEADVAPPEHGNIHLIDSETGESMDLFIDAMVARRYQESFNRHRDNWREACRKTGARFASLTAENLAMELRQLEEIQLLAPA